MHPARRCATRCSHAGRPAAVWVRHRRRLGHAVADGDLVHVHAGRRTASSPRPGTATRHHAGAQAREVERVEVGVGELGDEHRRHAVQRRCSARPAPPVEHRPSASNASFGDHHRRPVRRAAEVAHDHAEAVVEGHRDAEPVLVGDPLQLGGEVAVVQDVPVRQRGALREAGGARRVLDVDGIGRETG